MAREQQISSEVLENKFHKLLIWALRFCYCLAGLAILLLIYGYYLTESVEWSEHSAIGAGEPGVVSEQFDNGVIMMGNGIGLLSISFLLYVIKVHHHNSLPN